MAKLTKMNKAQKPASRGFQFKRFFVEHLHCAMKVNTDGILLGAIADCHQAKRILDIGTGSGLVALMLAQRTEAQDCRLFALEIEPNAYQQAVKNVENSLWRERMTIYPQGLFEAEFAEKFDLIVANPPYFEASLASKNPERDLARAVSLASDGVKTAENSHLAWLLQAKNWLAENGKICFILPTEQGEKLAQQAVKNGLFLVSLDEISTKIHQPAKRLILTFGLKKPAQTAYKKLAIYDEQNCYSEAYKKLTAAFYLKG